MTSGKKHKSAHLKLKLNNALITKKENLNLLGINFDSNLSFKKHFKDIN